MYTHTHIHRYTCTLLLGCLCCLVASLAAWLSRSNMVSLSALHTLTPAHAQSVHCSVAGAELWLRLTLFSQMSLTHFYQLQKGQSALHCYRRRFTLTPAWRASMCEWVCVCAWLCQLVVCVCCIRGSMRKIALRVELKLLPTFERFKKTSNCGWNAACNKL